MAQSPTGGIPGRRSSTSSLRSGSASRPASRSTRTTRTRSTSAPARALTRASPEKSISRPRACSSRRTAARAGSSWARVTRPGTPATRLELRRTDDQRDHRRSRRQQRRSTWRRSSGVFTSTDGGQNWTQPPGSAATAVRSALDLHPAANARILHAGVAGNGVFRSTDGGATFTAGAEPRRRPPWRRRWARSSFSRVVVALAPSRPRRPNVNGIQVIYVDHVGGLRRSRTRSGVFMSTDQGATWTQQTATGISGTTYGGYALDMAVDPASPGDGSNDIDLFRLPEPFRSTDSGATFSSISVGHADTHTWTCVPQSGGANTVVYCGSDGGIDVSTNAGSTWSPKNNGGLQTGLFYNIASSPTQPPASRSARSRTTRSRRPRRAAGSRMDRRHRRRRMGRRLRRQQPAGPVRDQRGTEHRGRYVHRRRRHVPEQRHTALDRLGRYRRLPAEPDSPPTPAPRGILYVSGSTEPVAAPSRRHVADHRHPRDDRQRRRRPDQWQPTSSSPRAARSSSRPTRWPPRSGARPASPSPTSRANLPGRNVARAVFDPVDPNRDLRRARRVLDGPFVAQNVFRTTVGAGSWTNISPPLDLPCGAIAVDGTTTPTTLYVGTDFGVLRSIDGGASWSVLDDIHFPQGAGLRPRVQRAGRRAARRHLWPRRVRVREARRARRSRSDSRTDSPSARSARAQLPDPHRLQRRRADLVITNVERLFGSTDFTVLPTPATP